MTFHIIIPARYGSTRLPGKPLLLLHGKPLLQWVIERAQMAHPASITVATDDTRIADVAAACGVPAVLTSTAHESGTDRLAEAAHLIGLKDNDIVVNLQGDEPFMPAIAIQQVADTLACRTEPMATLCTPLTSSETLINPNGVKVVFNQHQQALYFSRSPIPFGAHTHYRHIGIYAYRVAFLKQYVAWGPCALEMQEKLEQLRALWHNIPIVVPIAQEAPVGDINTPEDLKAAHAWAL